MTIEIDDRSGFCFGVVNAITLTERALSEHGKVFSLGDIVHNRVEMERLTDLGLESIGNKRFCEIENATVLIRAHGEPPLTYKTAKEHRLNIIDATCPVVAKLQKVVAEAHRKMRRIGGQVVLLGKKGHAEVVGLTGQVPQSEGGVIVVENPEDLDAVDFTRPVYFLSQTTQSLSLFNRIKEEIGRRAADPDAVIFNDTICRQVANREPHLREFAAQYDVVIFVSGRKSSNGKALFEICRLANPNSHMVEEQTELEPEWFEGAESVGICGATSTPRWIMVQVAEAVERLTESL